MEKNDKGYFTEGNVGFLFNMSSMDTDFDPEKYPYLTQFEVSLSTGPDMDGVVSEEVMTTHMISMLRYMADNIEENGLNIYGFVTVVDKETLIEYSNKEDIAYIKTNPIR